MPTATVPRSATSPLLTETQEHILKAVNALPFMSAHEIRRLVFSKGSLSSARAHLRQMAGGEDGKEGTNDGYLCRVALPTRGNWLFLYTISSRGARYLRRIGEQVHWRRPYKLRHYSFSYLRHQYACAQVLVSLYCFCVEHPAYQVVEALNSSQLLREPPQVKLVSNGQEAKVPVIPDAWAYVERVAGGRGTGLWFEIDNNGSEYRLRYQQLLRRRLALIKNGYSDYFGTKSVLLCYLVTGGTPQQRKTRLRALCRWTKEVLAQEELKDWAAVFHFAVVKEDIYTTPLWDAPVWYRLYSFHRVRLLDSISPSQQGDS